MTADDVLFSLRAQIASCLWGAMAQCCMDANALALATGMPLRRVTNILRCQGKPINTAEMADMAWALRFEWQVSLLHNPDKQEPQHDPR